MFFFAHVATCAPMDEACRSNAVRNPVRTRYSPRAISSERRNPSTVCAGDNSGRLSNHFGTSSSALAPTATPLLVVLPSTSISTRTNSCGVALMVIAPKRNGRANCTGRSKNAISRSFRRGAMALVQRTLREKVLADALYEFGEHRVGHHVQRARARQRHVVDGG